jgi:hypothetical protein
MMKVTEDRSVKYASGAVRSSDAEATRYDLITPIGLAAVAAACAEGAANGRATVTECLNECLRETYIFLSGDRNADHLAHAALAVMRAIQENGRVKEDMHEVR